LPRRCAPRNDEGGKSRVRANGGSGVTIIVQNILPIH
jgi:hypothetical protein